MSKVLVYATLLLMISGLALSGCNYPSATQPVGQPPDPILTAAAATVQAQLTQSGPGTQPTIAPPASATAPGPTASAPTQAPPTQPAAGTGVPQPSAAPTSSGSTTPCNRAELVSDVTFPDGSQVPTGATFIKTWRLKNTGTCTWDSSYSIVFVDNYSMGGPKIQQLTNGKIGPGATADISLLLKAPGNTGTYESDWKLQDGASHVFGVGSTAASSFWVKIDVVQGTRVSMESGRTSVIVNGHVGKNGSQTFIIGARASQVMMLAINTINQPVYMEIQAPDGSSMSEGAPTSWQGALPEDGDYLVTVTTTGAASDFNFTLTIPVRITFDQGATSAKVKGVVGAKEFLTYLLKASKNQTMNVTITAPDKDVFLTIYGFEDGSPYIRYMTGQSSFSFKLPSTQDYVIQAVSTGNSTEDITVEFVVK